MNKTQLTQPVLVVDDEADIRDLMEMTLTRMGLSVYTAVGVQAAKKQLDNHRFSLVLTDMRMPDGSGLEVVDYITEKDLDVPVAVITAHGNADQAVQALKNGAFDYLQKPITLAQLRSLVKSAIKIHDTKSAVDASHSNIASVKKVNTPKPPEIAENHSDSLKTDNTHAVQKTKQRQDLPRLLGKSPLMEEVRQLVRKLACSHVPVYIGGESGSGKEQAARSIHELSPRYEQPFVAVNCGAIPENLMESEFFGYKKGSFTGADTDRLGFFQHAHGGTLFLDEVADLPLQMQVKLLRAIQEKAVRRIGDAQEKSVDVRIICATHKNLAAQVAAGHFRQDLFYRLNVVSITMPPLREMREDLPEFINILLSKHQEVRRLSISPAAQQKLLQYSYPGNFRELENILERAAALAQDGVITEADLQINSRIAALVNDNTGAADDADAAEPMENIGLEFRLGLTSIQDYLDEVESRIIENALKHTRHNRTQAAKLLGISFRSLRFRMERLFIESDE
ncbi:sigma-54-dependent transcriptional regulator [Stenoxybacter acetivorans]|uniref:sigma-54-dependent transcriptional regulator n=1 Tax=Stenoxybacter acetivorans TaxID=422441 RepID=UPI00055F4148|nr:sigma-54 dependent transcriptional regulator [Stenoxybacter acetivorans]